MKNAIFFSPNFPPNYKSFAKALKSSGARVLGLADDSYNQLSQDLKDNLTEYYKVENMHNYDELIRGIAYFIHKYGKIDILDSHSEYWLETEAQLRDDFNIPGLRGKDMKYIKAKSEMKKIYQKLGLRVAKGKVVKSFDEAKSWITEIGYPVIAKPDIGVGASATYKIHNLHELETAYETISNHSYIIEEFISGQIHSFDGIADWNSEPVFFTSHVFSTPVMDVVNKDDHIYYYSQREISPILEEAGRRCLKGFNVKNRFFHLEFFYTPKGEFVPLEVNIRPPGGLTADMFNYACEINVFQIWADLVINGVNKIEYSRKFHCSYVGRKNNKTYKNSHSEVLNKYGQFIVLNQEMPVVYRGALGDYCYITRAEKLDKIIEMAEFIQA
ncbi:MAG TPA: carboxylate--amine ligase [Lentisphaeria bacterium]|nr:MAG: hypothetical protein A2X47_08770 [Lentisphaerae bacterium GWF2_38_69]HBM15161.1 carboxylate--amine ligase [Lentisphaeria bacterium]